MEGDFVESSCRRASAHHAMLNVCMWWWSGNDTSYAIEVSEYVGREGTMSTE